MREKRENLKLEESLKGERLAPMLERGVNQRAIKRR